MYDVWCTLMYINVHWCTLMYISHDDVTWCTSFSASWCTVMWHHDTSYITLHHVMYGDVTSWWCKFYIILHHDVSWCKFSHDGDSTSPCIMWCTSWKYKNIQLSRNKKFQKCHRHLIVGHSFALAVVSPLIIIQIITHPFLIFNG